MNSNKKWCWVCKNHLPATLEYFYRCITKKDGLQGCCKKCHRIVRKKWDAENKEKIRETTNRKRKENPALVKRYARNYYLKHCERLKEKSRNANPKRISAQGKIVYALKKGELVRLSWCQLCGKEEGPKNTVAHHHDYDKPLVVIWLCRSHHRKLHLWKEGNQG